jgi:hypothetical protein
MNLKKYLKCNPISEAKVGLVFRTLKLYFK